MIVRPLLFKIWSCVELNETEYIIFFNIIPSRLLLTCFLIYKDKATFKTTTQRLVFKSKVSTGVAGWTNRRGDLPTQGVH